MFELLLQADKSLADGALAQAERTYRQLVDLDPSNAMALAGLARVALARGDERLARDFADRALDLDPESVAARNVLEILAHGGSESAAPESHAQEMTAARNLEILGRRTKGDGAQVRIAPDDEDEIDGATPTPVVAETESAPAVPVVKEAAAAKSTPAKEPATEQPPSGPGPGKPPPGGSRPDQMLPMPSEPLTERRQAGRLAAAAAATTAAAAATATPVRARQEPHHAMPLGRRHFEAEALRVPLADDFSRAEMTAAVEAVEAVDDVDLVADSEMVDEVANPDAEAMAPEAHPAGGDAGSAFATLDAVEATEPDESVAMRIAFMSDAAVLDAAESPSAEASGDTETTEAERALADATIAMRIALLPDAAEMEAAEREFGADEFETDEFEAAEFLAGHQAQQQGRAALQEVEAGARLESTEATFETTAELPTEPEVEDPRRRYARADDEDASEEQAEAHALREALAIVLGGEGDAAPVDPAEDPVVEDPVVEDPVVEDPVVEDPVVEDPVVE
ncbi:MAG TPA: hypothetical protein VFC12_06315, partial [Terriglobales bacterium]|nr:hypothetical protein [Terriglobales bacterium]